MVDLPTIQLESRTQETAQSLPAHTQADGATILGYSAWSVAGEFLHPGDLECMQDMYCQEHPIAMGSCGGLDPMEQRLFILRPPYEGGPVKRLKVRSRQIG